MYLFEGFGPLLWVAAVMCFLAWYPLSWRQPDGFYNLALAIVLVVIIVVSGAWPAPIPGSRQGVQGLRFLGERGVGNRA
jgi:hypothetical protein